jgi:hypothetical protein
MLARELRAARGATRLVARPCDTLTYPRTALALVLEGGDHPHLGALRESMDEFLGRHT